MTWDYWLQRRAEKPQKEKGDRIREERHREHVWNQKRENLQRPCATLKTKSPSKRAKIPESGLKKSPRECRLWQI
jgi:hypothetical protein